MENRIAYYIDRIVENNDELALEELYKHYFPGLLSFAYSILKNRENAEEVVLDVFLKLWENRKTLKTISKLSNYLYVATKHACISHLRKKNILHFDELEDGLSFVLTTPEQEYLSKENIKIINDAIEALPPQCKLIFRLIKEERLTYAEAADLLGLSKKTIEAQLYIAYKKIIERLAETLPEFKSNFKAG